MSKEEETEIALGAALARHNQFYDHLTEETVEQFRQAASPDIR